MSLPAPTQLQSLQERLDAYREAFEEVQRLAEQATSGAIPKWVFTLSRFPLTDLEELDPDLAEAEAYRRACRVALHSMVEFLALQDTGDEAYLQAVASKVAAPELDKLEAADQQHLDRFISIMNYAKTERVIYVNGAFQPTLCPEDDDIDDDFTEVSLFQDFSE